jgi:hypothetical protein
VAVRNSPEGVAAGKFAAAISFEKWAAFARVLDSVLEVVNGAGLRRGRPRRKRPKVATGTGWRLETRGTASARQVRVPEKMLTLY